MNIMKTINLIFYFPNDWYQFRSVKIRSKGKFIGKIKYADETVLNISDDINELKFAIDFYSRKLEVAQIENESYGVVYFNIKNYVQFINPKILQIKTFQTALDRQEFCNNLYLDLGNTTPINDKNKLNLSIGLFISALLIATPFYPESFASIKEIGSKNINLPFILGIGGFIAYLRILLNKRISVSNYKFRIYITIFSYALSLLYINSTLLIVITLLTLALLIRSYFEFKEIKYEQIPSGN